MSHSASHPLEPLSAGEVRRVVEILNSAGKVTPTTRFVSVSLREPPKQFVHGFDGTGAGPPPPARQAFAVLFDNASNACHEAVVS